MIVCQFKMKLDLNQFKVCIFSVDHFSIELKSTIDVISK